MTSMLKVRTQDMANVLALSVGLTLLLLGAYIFPANSFVGNFLGGTVSHLLGSFLIATGIQIILWVVGIRLEIFGTATDIVEPNAMSSDSNHSLSKESDKFYDLLERAEQKSRLHQPFSKQIDNLMASAQTRLTQVEHNPSGTLLSLYYDIEKAVWSLYEYNNNEYFPASAMLAVKDLAQRKVVTQEVADAFEGFWSLRNQITHGLYSSSDTEFPIAMINMGNRLLILLSAPSTSYTEQPNKLAVPNSTK